MKKKTNKLTAVYLKWELKITKLFNSKIKMLRHLKDLYKYTDRFFTIFSYMILQAKLWIMQKLRMLNNSSFELFFKLFVSKCNQPLQRGYVSIVKLVSLVILGV